MVVLCGMRDAHPASPASVKLVFPVLCEYAHLSLSPGHTGARRQIAAFYDGALQKQRAVVNTWCSDLAGKVYNRKTGFNAFFCVWLRVEGFNQRHHGPTQIQESS